ncbi:MAG: amino acid adenylation domain-containing protein, partial [Pseudomonadales bacterium]
MSLTNLLEELDKSGVVLFADGESLKVEGKKGALTPELRSSLKEYRSDIMKWLQASANELGLPTCQPDPENYHLPFPLSDLQRGFYIAEDPFMEFHVRPHYYLEKNFDNLDIVRYQTAWDKVIHRHKNEIVLVNSDANLEMVKTLDMLNCQVVDLRNKSDETVKVALSNTRKSMMRSELPLDSWPWLELKVSVWNENGTQKARMHYNHNNFFSDGMGLTTLLGEVDQFYQDPSLTLPPLTLGIRDAVKVIDQLANSEKGLADKRYWEDRLPSLPGPPELPVISTANRRIRSCLNRRECFLSAERWSRFKATASELGLTPSGAVFSVYAEILSAWSNQRHFVLSNMVTRRLDIHPDIMKIVGNFASLYPLEIDFREGKSFVERAHTLQKQVIRDTEHLYWGGMQVMQSLNRKMGEFGRAPIPFVVGSGLFMEGFNRYDFSCLETSQVMLDHQFWELPDGRYYYVWDLLEEFFPEGLIDDMLEAYGNLLEHLADYPQSWQEESFQVVPERQIAERLNTSSAPRDIPDRRLEDLLAATAANNQGSLALQMSGFKLTYRELLEASDRVATQLIELGVVRGQRVAVVADRSTEILQAVYGILKAGAAYVPIDPRLPQERLAYLLKNCGAALVITQRYYKESLAWPSDILVASINTHDSSVKPFQIPALPVVKLADEGELRTGPGQITDLAYIIYTSGSTGHPKGVMIDHRGPVNTVLDLNNRYQVGDGDRIFGVSSFGFDLSVYDIFGAAASGATIVYPDPENMLNPSHWLDSLIEQKVTIWNSVPPLAVLLVELAELRGILLPEMRLFFLSGDWIPIDLPDRLRKVAPNARVVSLGGATEASIWSILYEIGQVDPTWNSIPYGYPMSNQPWFILDAVGRPAPEWTEGELYIGGTGLALGYWNDKEKTSASFIEHPTTGERIYRTGDMGRYVKDGLIEFRGRRDSQVKIQGHRIELGEIEALMLTYPGISRVIAAVQRSESSESKAAQLVAYVVLDVDASIQNEALKDYLKPKLPDYMIPRLIKQVTDLPLNSNGKVDRNALPPIAACPKAVDKVVSREPKNETESQVLDIWQKVLGYEQLTVIDNFFDLGGQSFEGVQILGRVREIFGISLSLGSIWEKPTVELLAEFLEKGTQESSFSRIVEINMAGSGTPLVMVHPAGGNVLCYRSLGEHLSQPVYAFQAPGVDG